MGSRTPVCGFSLSGRGCWIRRWKLQYATSHRRVFTVRGSGGRAARVVCFGGEKLFVTFVTRVAGVTVTVTVITITITTTTIVITVTTTTTTTIVTIVAGYGWSVDVKGDRRYSGYRRRLEYHGFSRERHIGQKSSFRSFF